MLTLTQRRRTKLIFWLTRPDQACAIYDCEAALQAARDSVAAR